MQNSFDVPKLGRLQISLSNGYDPKIVAAGLMLSPLKVEVVGYVEGGVRLLVTYPKGIHINIVENTEAHNAYYANTEHEAYELLFVPRKPGNGVILSENPSRIVDDLLRTRKHPIVVEPVFSSSRGAERLQLLIACFSSIKIQRTEKLGLYTAHDPFVVPTALQGLMEIVREEIPKDQNLAQTLSKRVKNVRELFQWYEKRVLADEVRESLKVLLTQLNDYQIRVDGQLIHQGTPAHAGHITFDQNNPLVSFLKQFEGELAFDEVSRALLDDSWLLPPIHECTCGGQPELQTQTVKSDGGPKSVFYVRCGDCERKSNRNDWGLAAQTIASWNKQNGNYFLNIYPMAFAMDGLNENQIHAKLKQINSLAMKLVPAFKQLPPSAQDALEGLVEHATEIQIWASYIRTSLKERKNSKA